ncbi:MAG: 5-(carboxyamino)imidazole ribonucleotide synthase [Deltaproteobacteria bacterium]|nr:5-(carboxyamino)imidazole ribonucleotide synthase [Deltaproteobacteria bacterium]
MSSKSSIGILGSGQLGMMLAEAADVLKIPFGILETPSVGDAVILKKWLPGFSVVTVENEFLSTEILKSQAPAEIIFAPSLKTIDLIQDKLTQKEFLCDAGLPVPPFRAITTKADCLKFAKDHGWPIVLKERRNGYDGRGTYILRTSDALDGFWNDSAPKRYLLAEQFIPFATELAIQIARNETGEVAYFPIVETFQSNGICLWVKAPAEISSDDQTAIQAIATTMMEKLNAVGVFAVELFYTAGGEIFINELAPRVHNSGHYTIEGCETSQFAQHLLAINKEALGKTTLRHPAVAMLNLLGDFDGPCKIMGEKNLSQRHPAVLHWYHKQESRRGRKLGHITAWGETTDKALNAAIEARKELNICPKNRK